MLNQFLFLFFLHALGVSLGLLLKKQTPLAFCCLSGFLWGELLWVGMALLMLSTGVPYTVHSTAGVMIVVFLVLLVLNARKNSLSRREKRFLAASMVLYAGIFLAVSQFNIVVTTPDSFSQLINGRVIAQEHGLSDDTKVLMADRGPFYMVFQSAAYFLKLDYFYAFHPISFIVFIICFFYFCQKGFSLSSDSPRFLKVLPLLPLSVLLSTYIIFYQAFYIHNNMVAAIYLFVYAATAWLGLVEENYSWFSFSMLALLAFMLNRVEGPLFALVFLVPLAATTEVSLRVKRIYILPFLVAALMWQLRLYSFVVPIPDASAPVTYFLTQERILGVGFLLAGFGVFLCLSRFRRPALLLNWLPEIMLIALIAAAFLAASVKPRHMFVCALQMLRNVFVDGGWGATWWMIAVSIAVAHSTRRIPHEKFFSIAIRSSVITIFLLSFFRVVNRIGFGDSANRMLIHLFPVILFYIALKWRDSLRIHGAGPG